MNNDFLAGILSGSTGPTTPLQTGKKQSGSDTGDFMSLLQNRLAFDADAISGSTQSKINFSFRNSSGAGNINPLLINGAATRFLSEEKPTVAITSEKNQEQDVRSEAPAEKKTDEFSRKEAVAAEDLDNTDKISEKKIDSEEAVDDSQKATDQTESAENQVSDMQSIESLLAQFTPEEQQNLINALQKLSPEDLQALGESPEGFQNKLAELIASMPESEERTAMLELVNRSEFKSLLTEISAALQVTVPSQETTGTTMEIEAAGVENSEVTSGLVEAKVESEDSMEQKGETEDSETTENSENLVSSQETSGQELAAVSAQQQPVKPTEVKTDVSTDDNAEQQSAETAAITTADNAKQEAVAGENQNSEKAVESTADNKETRSQEKDSAAKTEHHEAKAELKAEHQLERESLRQEFKRLNESGGEQAVTETNTDTSEGSTAPQNQLHTGVNPSAAEVKPAIEEAARRFFSLLSEKAQGNGRGESQAFSAAPAENTRRSVHTPGSSSNGGLSNGYGYQSGSTTNANSAARASNPVPVTTTAFAELLDKAEFVKTRNGSKVLNIELDPKELGKMEMELTSKDGAVTARISAENALAKAKLEELAPQIKEQLVNQGVNLTEITVDISSRDSDGRNENHESGRNNKSSRISASTNNTEDADTIIRKNILPNLRRAALNIQSVDMTV